VIVTEDSMNPKICGSGLFPHPRHLSHTFDPNLFKSIMLRRWNHYFDSDIGSNWRAPAAEDQSAIQRNIAREPTFGVFPPVIPMENDGQSESVSHRGPAFEGGNL
jgi:hypothetical protein